MKRHPLHVITFAACAALAACASLDESAGPEIDQRQEALVAPNQLTFNQLTFNQLTFNQLTFNQLTFNSLTSAQRSEIHDDPGVRLYLKYLYECSMAPGASMALVVDGINYGTFEGQFGLGPCMQGGTCTTSSKRWVSACLIARVNHYGEKVMIAPIKTTAYGPSTADHLESQGFIEGKVFGTLEGAYFGNIFATTPTYYACANERDGIFNQDDIETRFCGPDTVGCDITAVHGDCAKVDITSSIGTGTCFNWRSNGGFDGCFSGGIFKETYYDTVARMFKVRWKGTGTRYDEVIAVYRADECPHADFVTGRRMPADCSPCAAEVGAMDPYCKNTWWDSECVSQAKRYCAAHNVATTGSALAPEASSCTNIVTSRDEYCGLTSWDSTCVSEAADWCR